LVVFVWGQGRTPHPVLDLAVFRHLGFAFGNLAALINYSATFAVAFLLSLYLQVVRGLDAGVTGVVLLAQPVLMMLLSPVAGRLSDRIAPRLVASAGLACTAAGLTVCARLDAGSPVAMVVAAQAVIGVGFGLFSSPNTNAVMSAVERRHFGIAAAVLATMRLVGQALSMALVTVLFAVALGNAEVSPSMAPQLLKAIRTAFAVFAALNVLAVFASLARGRAPGSTGAPPEMFPRE
jgi:MFS family permease